MLGQNISNTKEQLNKTCFKTNKQKNPTPDLGGHSSAGFAKEILAKSSDSLTLPALKLGREHHSCNSVGPNV